MMNETFADRIYKQREKHINKKGKPMSKRDFADFLGVPFTTYDKWENGGFAKSDSLIEIAQKCNCSVDWLLGLSDVESPDADLQAICNKTGLSEEGYTNICNINMDLDNNYLTFLLKEKKLEFINEIIKLISSDDLLSSLCSNVGSFYSMIEINKDRNVFRPNINTDDRELLLIEQIDRIRIQRQDLIDSMESIIDKVVFKESNLNLDEIKRMRSALSLAEGKKTKLILEEYHKLFNEKEGEDNG